MKRDSGLLCGLILLLVLAGNHEAAATKIVHTPPSHIVPGYRVHLTAMFEDPAGIIEARCYFRAATANDYVFIVLEESAPGSFYGVLPPPTDATKQVEYLFQAINGNNEIVSSGPMRIPVKVDDPPLWQSDVLIDVFRLLTELDTGGGHAPGFANEHILHAVDAGKRYGSVSDIYPGADTGQTVATDAGRVTVTPEETIPPRDPASAEPDGKAEPDGRAETKKTPRGKVVRNVIIGGVVAGGAAGAAIALSDSGSSGNPDIEPIEEGPNASVDVDLIVNSSFSTLQVLYATGSATGPAGATFRLEVQGPIRNYSETTTIGESNRASLRIDINEERFTCSTYVVRGTVTAAGGGILASRTRTFTYLCD